MLGLPVAGGLIEELIKNLKKEEIRIMKHKQDECANCGAARRPGSTLCDDCITACGGGTGIFAGDHRIFIDCFRSGRKVAEIDITGYRFFDLNKLIKIQIDLNRTIQIRNEECHTVIF